MNSWAPLIEDSWFVVEIEQRIEDPGELVGSLYLRGLFQLQLLEAFLHLSGRRSSPDTPAPTTHWTDRGITSGSAPARRMMSQSGNPKSVQVRKICTITLELQVREAAGR
jgi:hypothetical protein